MLSNLFQQVPELCTFANLDLQVGPAAYRNTHSFCNTPLLQWILPSSSTPCCTGIALHQVGTAFEALHRLV